jgi:hypothetical protein
VLLACIDPFDERGDVDLHLPVRQRNISLRVWLPTEGAIRARWLLPAIEGVLLLVLVLGDPARLASQRRWLRPLAVFLVGMLVVAALWATTLLIYDLIKGIGVTEKPEELLASGAVV